jgi:seryl-tRNA synthetase
MARRLAASLLALAVATTAAAADEAADLSQSLIRLRGEVESLNNELELVREEQRSALGSLGQQRAELEAQLNRQEQSTRELRERMARQADEAGNAGVAGDSLKPILAQALAQLRQYIQSGLPFKTDERLAALTEIETQVANGTLPPHRAANRVWAFYEDEFRITRETGLYKQTVALGKEQVLADVVKIGSMMLYFKTQDGRMGHARREAAGWRFVVVDEAADQERIALLFDSLGKQIRQGYFELPAALAVGGG